MDLPMGSTYGIGATIICMDLPMGSVPPSSVWIYLWDRCHHHLYWVCI